MAYYVGDQNQVVLFYESGTYASSAGTATWIGMVQSHTPKEDENVTTIRYAGAGTRNVSDFYNGGTSFGGTLEYYPQDWRFLKFALGSCVDTLPGSPTNLIALHAIRETNSNDETLEIPNQPLPSFTIEDAQAGTVAGSNFIRTINGGIVDTMDIEFNEGEPVKVTVDYIGQSVTFSSGAASSVTASTDTPYLWSHTQLEIPSGTTINNVKSVKMTLKNNIDARYYLDGTKNIGKPIPVNRDYEVSLDLTADEDQTKTFYNNYYLNGTAFNAMLKSVVTTGSQQIFIIMSGCRITAMDAPSKIEGVNEQSITIVPKSVAINVNDEIEKYNLW